MNRALVQRHLLSNMKHNRLAFLLPLTIVLLSQVLVSGQKTFVSLNIENAATGQTIPSTMHGMILETNINRDDDGGLYAELIYNRAFQGELDIKMI